MIEVMQFLCASPDTRGAGMPEGPVAASLWDGGLGRAQTVCPRTSLSASGRGFLLADTPAFYGEIVGSGTFEARVAPDDRTAVTVRMEALRYQTVISAVPSSFTGYGHTTIGGLRVFDDERLAVVGQVVLPTAIGLYRHVWPVGVDLGLAGATRTEWWHVHGQVGLAASAAISRGPSQPRVGIPLTVGGAFRPGSAFALVLDLQSAFGYTAPLDHLAVAPAVRFAGGRSWGLELGATLPLAGRERALTAAELSTGIRF